MAGIINCPLCPPDSTPVEDFCVFANHIVDNHGPAIVDYYVCPCCPDAYRGEEDLQAHLNEKHENQPYEMTKKYLGMACADCGISFRIDGAGKPENERKDEWKLLAKFMAIHSPSRIFPYHIHAVDTLYENPHLNQRLPALLNKEPTSNCCPHCHITTKSRVEMKKHILKGGCVERQPTGRLAISFQEETNRMGLDQKWMKILEKEDAKRRKQEERQTPIKFYYPDDNPSRIARVVEKVSKKIEEQEIEIDKKLKFDTLTTLPVLYARQPILPYTPHGLRATIHCCINCRTIIAGTARAAEHVCENGGLPQLRSLFFPRPSSQNARLSCPLCDEHSSCSVFGLQLHLTIHHDVDYFIDIQMEIMDEIPLWIAENADTSAATVANENGVASSSRVQIVRPLNSSDETHLRDQFLKPPRSSFLPKEDFFRLCRICMTVMPPNANYYEAHMKKHANESGITSCYECSIVTTRKARKGHFHEHHYMEYRCVPCKLLFRDDTRYYMHLAAAHELDLVHFCKRCNLATKSVARLRAHIHSRVCQRDDLPYQMFWKSSPGVITEFLFNFESGLIPGGEFHIKFDKEHPNDRPHCSSADCAERTMLVSNSAPPERTLDGGINRHRYIRVSCPNDLYPLPFDDYEEHDTRQFYRIFIEVDPDVLKELDYQFKQLNALQIDERMCKLGIKNLGACFFFDVEPPVFIASTTAPSEAKAEDETADVEAASTTSTDPSAAGPDTLAAQSAALTAASESEAASTEETHRDVVAPDPAESVTAPPEVTPPTPAAPQAPTTMPSIEIKMEIEDDFNENDDQPCTSNQTSATFPSFKQPDEKPDEKADQPCTSNQAAAAAPAAETPSFKRPMLPASAATPAKRPRVESEEEVEQLRKVAKEIRPKPRRLCMDNFCKTGERFNYTPEQIRATKLEIGYPDVKPGKCFFCNSDRAYYGIPPDQSDLYIDSFVKSIPFNTDSAIYKIKFKKDNNQRLCARHFDLSYFEGNALLGDRQPLPKFMSRECLVCKNAIIAGLEIPLYYKEQVRVLSETPGSQRTLEEMMEECGKEVQYCCPYDALIASDKFPHSLPADIHKLIHPKSFAERIKELSKSPPPADEDALLRDLNSARRHAVMEPPTPAAAPARPDTPPEDFGVPPTPGTLQSLLGGPVTAMDKMPATPMHREIVDKIVTGLRSDAEVFAAPAAPAAVTPQQQPQQVPTTSMAAPLLPQMLQQQHQSPAASTSTSQPMRLQQPLPATISAAQPMQQHPQPQVITSPTAQRPQLQQQPVPPNVIIQMMQQQAANGVPLAAAQQQQRQPQQQPAPVMRQQPPVLQPHSTPLQSQISAQQQHDAGRPQYQHQWMLSSMQQGNPNPQMIRPPPNGPSNVLQQQMNQQMAQNLQLHLQQQHQQMLQQNPLLQQQLLQQQLTPQQQQMMQEQFMRQQFQQQQLQQQQMAQRQAMAQQMANARPPVAPIVGIAPLPQPLGQQIVPPQTPQHQQQKNQQQQQLQLLQLQQQQQKQQQQPTQPPLQTPQQQKQQHLQLLQQQLQQQQQQAGPSNAPQPQAPQQPGPSNARPAIASPIRPNPQIPQVQPQVAPAHPIPLVNVNGVPHPLPHFLVPIAKRPEMKGYLMDNRRKMFPGVNTNSYEAYLDSQSDEDLKRQFCDHFIQDKYLRPAGMLLPGPSNVPQQRPPPQPQQQPVPPQNQPQTRQQPPQPAQPQQQKQPQQPQQPQQQQQQQQLQQRPSVVVAPLPQVRWTDAPAGEIFTCSVCDHSHKAETTPRVRFDTTNVDEILDVLNVPKASMRRRVLKSRFEVEESAEILVCKDHVVTGGTSAMETGQQCPHCKQHMMNEEISLHDFHKTQRFCCVECFRPLGDEHKVLVHMKKKHRYDFPTMLRLDCPLKGSQEAPCDHVSTSMDGYRKHLLVHESILRVPCDGTEGHSCGLQFKTHEAMLLHKNQVAEDKLRLGRQEENLPCCPICGTIDLWEGEVMGQKVNHFTMHAFQWETRCRFDLIETRKGWDAHDHFLKYHHSSLTPADCKACDTRLQLPSYQHADAHLMIGLSEPAEPKGSIKSNDYSKALLGFDR